MDDTVHAALSGWGNFYVITGGAAAALTGLQFVVQTLIASDSLRPLVGSDPESGIAAFGTPTVVHFSLALLISAVLSAPWTDYSGLREALGVIGAGALVYSIVVLRRTHRQENYAPAIEDWIWHVLLPAAANLAILVAAVVLHRGATGPLFVVAGATLLLVCVGIHNAWDSVTYMLIMSVKHQQRRAGQRPPEDRTDSTSESDAA